jgi:hypothetical protein
MAYFCVSPRVGKELAIFNNDHQSSEDEIVEKLEDIGQNLSWHLKEEGCQNCSLLETRC